MIEGIEDRTVLVTGGAGFIGGHLIASLLARTRVVCVDKLTYAANRRRLSEQIANGLEFHEADVSDRSAMIEIVASCNPQIVFHLAAESHVDRSIDGPADFIQSNVLGTLTLLEVLLDYWAGVATGIRTRFRMIHVSTDEVFGSASPDEVFGIKSRYDPRSPYSASKAASDHLVRAWHSTYGLPTIVTNCSNNFGPFQFPEKLIPHTILRALEGRSIPVYGDGQHTRDWLHVGDHVAGLLAAASKGTVGSTYLFGARNLVTNLDLVRSICRELDVLAPGMDPFETRIEFVSDRPGHDRRYAVDPTSAESELGWTPAIDFRTGLGSVVRWYVDNLDWCRGLVDAGYTPARIGVRK